MSLSPIELEILNEHSDDDYAIWECVWGMRARHPELNDEERLITCQQTIKSLLVKECIELYTATRLADAYTPLQILPHAEFNAALDNPQRWHAPASDGEEVVFFAISEEGMRVLGREIERLGKADSNM